MIWFSPRSATVAHRRQQAIHYDNIKLPFIGYGHGATAADLNGDGLPDLVVTNTSCKGMADYCNPDAVTNSVPYVLINQGNGSFALDLTRLPKAVDERFESLQYWGIYGVELIDHKGNGKPDLFIGAIPESVAAGCTACAKNGVMRNNGTGYFNRSPMIDFPSFQNAEGRYFGGALDFVFSDGAVYFHHETPGSTPQGMAVRKVDLTDFSVTTVLTRTGLFSDGTIWPVWLYPAGNGVIRSREVNCRYPIQAGSSCGFSFKTAPGGITCHPDTATVWGACRSWDQYRGIAPLHPIYRQESTSAKLTYIGSIEIAQFEVVYLLRSCTSIC